MARISGLISGLDTDSLIQELVSAYETKKESYVKKKTKQGWLQETWKGLNTKVYGFYTGTLRNAQYSSTYNAKKATVSDSTKATVSASGSAVVGTQTLQVKQLAKTAYLTGGKVTGSSGNTLTANSKMAEFSGFSDGTIKVNVNGTEKEISLTSDMTVNQFVTKLKETGLNASFDVENQRFFVSGKTSGSAGKFSISATDDSSLKALTSLGLTAVSATDGAAYEAASKIDVNQKADTAYTNYVLTKANEKLSADIKEYQAKLDELNDQLKYATDAAYQTELEEKWQSSIDSYTEQNTKLQAAINEQLDYSGDAAAATTKKMSDLLSKNADGQYALNDSYYTTDADGNKTLDETKLADDLKDTGLTVDSVKEKLAEINKNAASLADNEKKITDIQDTKAAYEAAKNSGEAQLEGQIADTAALKDAAQAEYDLNAQLMKGTYKFSDESGNQTADTETAYTLEDGTAYTYADLKKKLSGYISAEDPTDNVSVGSTGLSASAEYKDIYNSFYTKYENEKTKGTELYQAYQDYTAVVPEGATDAEKEAIETARAEAAKKLGIDTTSSGAVKVEGSDAVIVVNGAEFTSDTNNFSINGLTITAAGVTNDGEEISINTSTDIDGMYESIKKMITGYNEILKEMNTLYYADSSKGYNPLSDDEKEAMSDDEIEKWEKKIKDSLLRRDDTLSGIMSAVKNSMAKSYTINGKSYSLSSFGIGTSGYFSVDNEEQGLYHINGDSEDSSTSGKEDKLKAALASDPDTVIQFFQEVSKDMYSTLTKKMERTSLRSSYTLYNDKQMQKQYEEYEDKIDEWDEKIENYTEKYVKQFTAMEIAMSKLQASTSQLSSILG